MKTKKPKPQRSKKQHKIASEASLKQKNDEIAALQKELNKERERNDALTKNFAHKQHPVVENAKEKKRARAARTVTDSSTVSSTAAAASSLPTAASPVTSPQMTPVPPSMHMQPIPLPVGTGNVYITFTQCSPMVAPK